MNSNFLLRSFRILLFPFALVYGAIVMLRNVLYKKKIFKTLQFNLPIICVGNLSVGGTGKSPMVEFLIEYLQGENQLAILSRGYRRKTKGYVLATEKTTALEVGDEPLMFKKKFSNVAVAVGEERVLAIPQLLQDAPNTNVIILDDAFQHRAINPSFNIVLTDCNNLYCNDFFLPTGDLRDQRSSANRADVIVVTKCAEDLSISKATDMEASLKLQSHQKIYFSTIAYQQLRHLQNGSRIGWDIEMDVLLVTGIANPKPIEIILHDAVHLYEKLSFNDHHIFDIDDIKNIEKQFNKLTSTSKIIVTTEKDAMRLLKFGTAIQHLPIYVLPIAMKVLFNKETELVELVKKHIMSFSNK
jgi:tetraacyldisaccharide 4'-kinase